VSGAAGWLAPTWRTGGVGALMTTRGGGVSTGRYASMNVGSAVGDDPIAVAANRARFAAALGAAPVYLRQVHGTRVVRIGAADALPGAPVHEADGAVTTEAGVACLVQAADCLPVLLAPPDGRAVGAAHAGWRGLAGGVVGHVVQAVCEAADCRAAELVAWLGACIGPDAFEVGADVRLAFGAGADARSKPHGSAKWLADLPGLARDRLRAAGVVHIEGGNWCTVSDPSRFFSFRRDGVTGRMAAAVWIARR
jgi:purine-nucleoside/S-methyl-5'-thioadenosine phosphorylase / adenosine deaminase